MNKQNLSSEFGACIDSICLHLHKKRLEKKAHTSYCIVKRFSEFVRGEITDIDKVFSCKSQFGCDFLDHQFLHMMSDTDYERLLNQPCNFVMDFWDGFRGPMFAKVREIQNNVIVNVGNEEWPMWKIR